MLSPRIGGWGAEGAGGGGGFDIYSDSSPLEIVSSPSLLLPLGNFIIPVPPPPPPPPPLPFFVTITYIQEIERVFLVLVVFIYSLIQNRLYEVVGHFTVFVPSLCWCRRFDKLTVITTLRGLRDSPDAVNKKHSVEVS